MLFVGLLFLFLRVFLGRFRLLGRMTRQTPVSKKLIQQREGCRSALRAVVLLFRIVLAKHAAHFIAEHIQVVLRNAHLLDHLVNLGNSETSGTFQTISFIQGVSIFHLGNENHRYIFLAFHAHFRLHILSLL